MAIWFRIGQRLRPHSLRILYGTAEAVPFKESALFSKAEHAAEKLKFMSFEGARRAGEDKIVCL